MEYLSFFIAVLILFVVLKIISLPLKLIIKLMINAFIGGVVLFLINMVGASFGLYITITWISALIVGFFGVPGVVLVVLLSILM